MKERIKHLILFITLIGIDQAVKYWVKTTIINKPFVIIPDVLVLQYHENTGAVWGIMSGKVEFLRILTLFILLFIVYLYFKIPQGKKYNLMKIITIFILAGAVGNQIDRMYLSYVVDFIYFELINFPIFNIADSYLTVSSLLLFVVAIFYYKDDDLAFLDQLFKKKKQADTTSTDVAEEEVDEEVTDNTMDDKGN